MIPTPDQIRNALINTHRQPRNRTLRDNQRKLPPYGRKLINLRPGPADELRLYFGSDNDAWNHARIRNIYVPPALVLPPGTCVSQFNWPVADWQVFAIQLGDYSIDKIPNLARLLLESGAAIVRVLYGNNPDLAIYRPAYREADQ